MLSIFWSIFRHQPKAALQFLMQQWGAIGVYDKHGQPLYYSRKFASLVPVRSQPSFFEAVAIDSHSPQQLGDYWQQALSGETVWFLAKAHNFYAGIECCLQFHAETELMVLTVKRADQYAHVRQLTETYEQIILRLFNHPSLAAALIDTDGTVIQCNQRLHDLLGTTADQRLNLAEFIHPDDRRTDAELRQRLLDGALESYTLEQRLIDRSHDLVWVNTNTSLMNLPLGLNGQSQYFVVLLEDITENRKMYSALVRTEEKWKTVVLNSLYLFLQTSSTGQIVYASPAVEQVLGYREEELLDFYISDLAHPEDLNEFEHALNCWANGIPYREGIECRWRTRSGQWVCLCIQGHRFPLSLEIDGMVISGYNITDRKFLETKLRASEEKFRSLLLNLPGAVFRCDLTYTTEFMSDEVHSITGYRAAEFIDNRIRSYLSIVHPEDVDLIRNSVTQLTLNRRPCSIEYRITHANGAMRWVSEYRQGVFDETGRLLWLDGILFNVSDRQPAEADLSPSHTVNRAMLRGLPSLTSSTSDRQA